MSLTLIKAARQLVTDYYPSITDFIGECENSLHRWLSGHEIIESYFDYPYIFNVTGIQDGDMLHFDYKNTSHMAILELLVDELKDYEPSMYRCQVCGDTYETDYCDYCETESCEEIDIKEYLIDLICDCGLSLDYVLGIVDIPTFTYNALMTDKVTANGYDISSEIVNDIKTLYDEFQSILEPYEQIQWMNKILCLEHHTGFVLEDNNIIELSKSEMSEVVDAIRTHGIRAIWGKKDIDNFMGV